MGVSYRAVGWNRQKRRYDVVAGLALLFYLAVFVGIGQATHPNATIETLLIRGFGTGAFLLLHLILAIGPLCRFSDRFLPLLYNRRHLGVMLFALALGHVVLVTVQFHLLGPLRPLVSILTEGGLEGGGPAFQVFGLGAFVVLLFMAATSHDFWLRNLGAPAWKALHMLVYVAYLLLVAHVSFGILHQEQAAAWFVPVLGGTILVGGLHAGAAVRSWREDRGATRSSADSRGCVAVCRVDDLPLDRGRTFRVGDRAVAVFRHSAGVSAVANECRHQNGPLGEGRILDGCIVCPWHGYQYDPATGTSPPPFTEKVATFRVRVQDGTVLIDPRPLPPGTPVKPA